MEVQCCIIEEQPNINEVLIKSKIRVNSFLLQHYWHPAMKSAIGPCIYFHNTMSHKQNSRITLQSNIANHKVYTVGKFYVTWKRDKMVHSTGFLSMSLTIQFYKQ